MSRGFHSRNHALACYRKGWKIRRERLRQEFTERLEQAFDLFTTGKNTGEVSLKLGVSEQTARKYLHQLTTIICGDSSFTYSTDTDGFESLKIFKKPVAQALGLTEKKEWVQ